MSGMNSQRTGLRVAAIIFAIVTIAHIARALTHAKVVLGHLTVPMQVSWVAIIVSGLLCVSMWRLSAGAR